MSDTSGSTAPAGASAPAPLISTIDGDVPDGLLDAFDAYEAALAANDQEALADAFEDSPGSLRADGNGLLVGHEAITAFRGRRGVAPSRSVVQRHIRVLDDGAALVVSVNAPASGGRGVVTQLWRRSAADGTWRIAVAQVQAPTPVFDTRIWRVVGAPLVPSSADSAAADALIDGLGSADDESVPGPLTGETVAVKDLFAVAGHRVGAGVPSFLSEQDPAPFHSPAVQALLDAGASILGIAQTDEFAFSIAGRNSAYGTPPNGVVPGAISGGSTSGPASAVALGHVSIGLGTDTGGSIRVPASYQGLWGLRTTHGVVRRTDVLPLAPTFDTVGWLTRSASLLGAVASATLTGVSASAVPQQRPVESSFVVDPRLLSSLSEGVRDAFEGFLGASIESGLIDAPAEVALGDIAHLYELFRVIQAAEAWQSHGAWIEAHPGALAPDVSARFEFGRSVTPSQESAARDELEVQREHLEHVLADRILLLPSASSAAPSLTATPAEFDRIRSNTLGLTCIAGVGGLPAVSAPLLEVPAGPVGLCLVGPRGGDLALVEVAAALAA
ncbi:AtzH-like domain-containing protein [Frondihabitans australicus]|uniref:Asp-tRNA(Asn)/Glu-tRNA(Gln) amidotransferase A subunit family amidase n=1 Tax=Frondihabitans australicus TaxID=386892 RepID=A0A495ILF4_9MICO|nr:AtzH-like domain-containing protein [Frondihabitans australicus]RKR75996.1 Asp-tRNA(Asn)/Glu-tRNA(Gln) amidotransferase A subunit family amidase [Frondihabitans australicus]